MRSLFALLLRVFPRRFRRVYGEEVLGDAVRECRAAFRDGPVAGSGRVAETCVDLIREGLSERWDERRRVRRDDDFGRDVGTMTTMSGWWTDLRHAVRTLARTPAFAVTTVGTLGVALGANAAIFGVVDTVLLEPLPFEEPERLVHIAGSAPGSELPDEFPLGVEFFLEYRDEVEGLESLATYNSFTATVRADDRVERLRVSMPTLSLFETLGVEPVLGRLPVEGEGGRVAVISHGLWTTWFGQDPDVIGRSYFFVDGTKEVVGVMGPDFAFPVNGVMAWAPMEYAPGMEVTPGRLGLNLVGRMAPGTDHASLARELELVASRLPELYGGSASYAELMELHVPVVRSVRQELLGPVADALWILMGAVAVVLLIACANVGNLFLVRSQGRSREMAVRRAIGAGRARLARLQLAESVVVAGAAALVAVAVAWFFLPAFAAAAPSGLPRVDQIGLDASALAFTALAAAGVAVLCGLIPALRGSAPDLDRLRDGVRGSTGQRPWVREALVVGQTALTLVLLVGSGLLLRSFQGLRTVDPGYDTEDILTFQFAPDQAHLTDGAAWAAFHLDFMDRLRALPDVEAVGIVENVPLDEGLMSRPMPTPERPSVEEGAPRASLTAAGGDYFRAMGIEVLQGRAFTDEDARIPGRVVVSRAAAERIWPGEDALGRRVQILEEEGWHTVVGVVEDVLQYDMAGEPEPLVYMPMVGPTPESWALSSPGYVVRSGRAATLAPEIRALVREVAPEAPMYRVHTMEELFGRSMAELTFTLITLALAAGLGLLLGATGLYGVLSHVVAERTREIGVRMALGAAASQVRRMVVVRAARVVLLGVLLGGGLAFLARDVVASQLYGVAVLDPTTLAGTVAVLTVVGVLASYLPARRASRVDPVESMRAG